MMRADDRAQAVYNALASQPGFSALNEAERARVKAQLVTVWGADLGYIVGNAQVNPATLQNPAGQPVATPMGAGATSAPAAIIGLGSVS